MVKLIIGLGNPGKNHERNRHNAGFLVLDKLRASLFESHPGSLNVSTNFKFSKKYESEIEEVNGIFLIKPQTLMNNSGAAVKKLVDFYKVKMEDLWIVHDDLDLALGDYKIQKEKGPKDHNGLNSIEKSLGKSSFVRVRVGVDARDPNNRAIGENYVLSNFSDEEMSKIRLVINKIVKEINDNLALSH